MCPRRLAIPLETRLLPRGSRRRLLALRFARPPISKHVRRNFRPGDAQTLSAVESSLREHYFQRWPDSYLQTPDGRLDLEDHLVRRLERARHEIVPWVNHAMALSGKRLLEIGSGTGASTLAFAEQGARVTALDLDEKSLTVAQDRCDAYGLDSVEFVPANATGTSNLFPPGTFDIIVFYASLEHMVYEEKIKSLAAAWELLPFNGLCVIIETPNRLWHYDSHTSLLPFFHWLPDDVAVDYAQFSPRRTLREKFRNHDQNARVKLARTGRSMSYHELEIAFGRLDTIGVVSSLSTYQRRRNLLRMLNWLMREYRFESALKRASSNIDTAFLHPYIDVILRKGSTTRAQGGDGVHRGFRGPRD